MRYIKLTEADEKKLSYEYANHPKHYFRQRCQALIWSNDGMSVPQIAKLLKVRTRTIYEWMNRWESKGFAGLFISVGRGRKPALSILDESLVEKVKKKPVNMHEA